VRTPTRTSSDNSQLEISMIRTLAVLALLGVLALAAALRPRPAHAQAQSQVQSHESGQPAATPLTIGETFTLDSKVLGESRRINVFLPTVYGTPPDGPVPVLYMPDGGIDEDFLHLAGLLQVLVSNGTMRPFLLVGIENTQRRRDLTGPTEDPEDRKIAPVVGGSANFRRFIRAELIPTIRARFRTTDESAIVGESLAGLFVVETLLIEPDLFDTYIAFDPSLWWNNGALVDAAADRHSAADGVAAADRLANADRRAGTDRLAATAGRSLYLATSDEPEIVALTKRLADRLATRAPAGLSWHYEAMPEETHGTIYHPAALRAFRRVFRP
jgi:predicted alpha/beta superfamily hydrolase